MKKILLLLVCVVGLKSCFFGDEGMEGYSIFVSMDFCNECDVDVRIIGYGYYGDIDTTLICGDSCTSINCEVETLNFYPSDVLGYSVKLVFGDDVASVKYGYFDTVPRSPLFDEAYEITKISEAHYKKLYTITQEDFQNALLNGDTLRSCNNL